VFHLIYECRSLELPPVHFMVHGIAYNVLFSEYKIVHFLFNFIRVKTKPSYEIRLNGTSSILGGKVDYAMQNLHTHKNLDKIQSKLKLNNG